MIQAAIIFFTVVTCGRACGRRDLHPVIGIAIALFTTIGGAILGGSWASGRIDQAIGGALLGTVLGTFCALVICAMLPDHSDQPHNTSSESGPYQTPRAE